MSQIKAILFDLDGTLFNRQQSIAAYAQQLVLDLQMKENHAHFVDTFLKLDNHGYANKAEVYGALQKQFDLLCTETWFLRHWEEHAWLHPQCHDHADTLLVELRNKGIKTGIITNGITAFQRTKIKNLHLEDRVDVILISEEIGYQKPDPTIFSLAANTLGVLNSECIFIGDHLEHDVLGSTAAGMKGILYDTYNSYPKESVQKMKNLREVLHFV
jgi:putative hydrolase of the HAD superfamily